MRTSFGLAKLYHAVFPQTPRKFQVMSQKKLTDGVWSRHLSELLVLADLVKGGTSFRSE
jgi:hypothetical protein